MNQRGSAARSGVELSPARFHAPQAQFRSSLPTPITTSCTPEEKLMPDNLPTVHIGAEIDAFLERLKDPTSRPLIGTGRLIFALDATASRQATWDQACRIQGEMFEATAGLGELEIRL